MDLKPKRKHLIFCLALPLAVGGLSALLTRDAMEAFQNMNQPPLSPPAWLFPVVWTFLFLLMGLASYLVYTSGAPVPQRNRALTLYGVQLAVNFCWTLLFFNARLYLFAFLWLVLLWVLILLTIRQFGRIRPAAGWLLAPYLLWVTFAGYLNFAIYWLN